MEKALRMAWIILFLANRNSSELQPVKKRAKGKSEAIVTVHGHSKWQHQLRVFPVTLFLIQATFGDLPCCSEKTCIKNSHPPCSQSLLFVSLISAVMLTEEGRRVAVRPLATQTLLSDSPPKCQSGACDDGTYHPAEPWRCLARQEKFLP